MTPDSQLPSQQAPVSGERSRRKKRKMKQLPEQATVILSERHNEER